MLFNSYEFLFVFLPVTVGGFYLLGAYRSKRLAILWLVCASLFFYGYWNPVYIFLILLSTVFNFLVGKRLGVLADVRVSNRPRALLALGVGCNLALLGYYKYANFFVDNANLFLDDRVILHDIALPLAISFFTFQQIAFLVDSYRGETRETNFLHYALFVTFFPQLIAGPIVHHKEMLPQFARSRIFSPDYRNLSAGITLLTIGLFKKAVVADKLAAYADPVFAAAGTGQWIWGPEVWGAALAYTFQLYFDFSGYVDMAQGAARTIGIRLPVNFNSPYKSLNIIEFWRRWHMTLSRFLRDYLYIALGGNRKGVARRYVNLLATMLLGGLWHGASWSFVFWGALHGAYLIVNHAWRAVRGACGRTGVRRGVVGTVASWVVTFTAVVVGWVFFRAENFSDAVNLVQFMFGNGFQVIPGEFSGRLGQAEAWLVSAGFSFDGQLIISLSDWVRGALLVFCSLLICVAAPNSNELFESARHARAIRWNSSVRWAAVTCVLFCFGLLNLFQVSQFLYFNF